MAVYTRIKSKDINSLTKIFNLEKIIKYQSFLKKIMKYPHVLENSMKYQTSPAKNI